MIEILQAIILGIIQGAGEFLPISSSGHLVLLPAIFNWDYQGVKYDVMLHLGTLVAVLIYFRKDLKKLLVALWESIKEEDVSRDPYRKLVWFLGLGIIPAVVFALIFNDQIETVVRSPLVVGFSLVTMGLLLGYADHAAKKKQDLLKIKWWQVLLIGFFQALALIPGVSRSGATITAGLILGFNRADAARFSFLLAIPTIMGAVVWSTIDFLKGDGFSWEMLVGMAVSAVVGYAAIFGLMRLIKTRSYFVFVVYRLILGGGILIWWFLV
jgi:undecaprenyl-diphosphatase